MMQDLFNYGSMQTLERMVQFTGDRHQLIVDNLANLNTPHYRAKDLDTQSFQEALGKAVDKRRQSSSPVHGRLDLKDTRQVDFHHNGMTTKARPSHDNLVFHDGNDRDLERIMQNLAENTMVHNASLQLLNKKFQLLKTAIRERL